MTDLFHRKETNQKKFTYPFPSHLLSGIQDLIFQSQSELAQVEKNTTAPKPSCRHSSNTRSGREAQSSKAEISGFPLCELNLETAVGYKTAVYDNCRV